MKGYDTPATRANRMTMVETQIESRGIHDPLVIAAMRRVPRHLFMPRDMREKAYDDSPLPIGWNQTISQPSIVAYMTQALGLKGGETVLEIGCGRGYQAAILSRIAGMVYTVERVPELAHNAKTTFDNLGITNVGVRIGDGTLGWEEKSPFDAILVTASGPRIPGPLSEQLGIQGRLVMPVGSLRYGQQLVRQTRVSHDGFHTDHLLAVAFVPLIGEFGWGEDRV
ncbi:protein-L-isoaspartate(D-aspartate) O-methyltransferase [Desulfoplanes sp.]